MTKKNKILLAVLVAVLMVVTVFVAACTDPHVCGHVCTTCHKCTDSTCTDDACSDKCDYNGTHPATHPTCENQCPTCHKCLTPNCGHDACKDKCDYNGTHPSNAPIVTAPFYGAIGSLTMDGGDIAAMSVLSFTPNGTIWAGDQSADGYYDEDSATYTISDSGAISIKVGSDEIGTGSIVGRTISVTITLEGSNGSKEFTYTGDLYKASVNIDGNSTEWYIAQGTPLYLLLSERDPDSTIKVNDAEIPYDQLAVTCMPASDDVTIVVTSPAEELDERTYFLACGALGWEKTDANTFSRTEGTNVYTLNNVKLVAGDTMKLRFNATAWDDPTNKDIHYFFGGYFFAKYSDVFVSTNAWDDNATVAAGKTGIYNITLTTKGANTATTGRQEDQIVSMVFDYVGSFSTEDMGWYLTGSMNDWAQEPTAYKLNATDNVNWSNTFTFDSSVTFKAIKVTKIEENGSITYSIVWSQKDGDVTRSAGKYLVSYNSTQDKFTITPYYTVSYSAGAHAADGVTIDPSSEECLSGNSVTLPAAINGADGWVFNGWSDGTTTYPAGSSYTVTKNATLTAVWAKVISIDDIAGVYTSADGEAIISDVVPQNETYAASLIVGDRYAPLYANSDSTAFAYQGFTVKYYEDGKVTINDVVYTRTGDVINTNLTAFKGTWKMDDGDLVLTITDDSISYSGDNNPTHFIIGKYLVLFSSSAEHYTLYVNDDVISGNYKHNDEITPVTFSTYVDETVYLSAIEGIWTYDSHTAYISTVKYNNKGDGSLILDGAFHWLTAGDNNTWTYTYNSYKVTVTYVDSNTVSIKAEYPYSDNLEGNFTKSDKALENGVLSNYDGEWDIAWNSNKYTLKVDSATNTFEFNAGWQPIKTYCIVGEYIVVSTGDPYFAFSVEPHDASDPTMTGKVTAGNGPETLVCELKVDDCPWADYFGAYTDEDSVYGVSITRDGLLVTIEGKTTFISTDALEFDDDEFTFNIGDVSWSLTYSTVKKWWNLYDYPEVVGVDVNLEKADYSVFVGTYAGDGMDSDDEPTGYHYVITITATMDIIFSINGESVTVTDVDCYGNGIDFTAGGICYNITRPGSNGTDDDGFAIKIYLEQYVSDYNSSSDSLATLNRTKYINEGACAWEDYIGVYEDVYDDDWCDDEYQLRDWNITITADGITLSIDGQAYTVEIVSFDVDDGFELTISELIDGTFYLYFDDDEVIVLTNEDEIEVYLWKQTDEEVDWEALLGTYEGTGNDSQTGDHQYKIVVTRRTINIYVDGKKVGVENEFNDTSSDYLTIEADDGYYGVYIQKNADGKTVEVKFERYKNSNLGDGTTYLSTTLYAEGYSAD